MNVCISRAGPRWLDFGCDPALRMCFVVTLVRFEFQPDLTDVLWLDYGSSPTLRLYVFLERGLLRLSYGSSAALRRYVFDKRGNFGSIYGNAWRWFLCPILVTVFVDRFCVRF